MWKIFSLLFFISPLIAQTQEHLGEGTIDPLRFSNFQVGYTNDVFLKVIDKNRYFHKEMYSLGIVRFSAETNLLNYLNAGFALKLSFDAFDRTYYPFGATQPPKTDTRLSPSINTTLFAKPFWPLLTNLGLYSKYSFGLSTAIESHLSSLGSENTPGYENTTYNRSAVGLVNEIAFGVDYYPFSRIGFFAESGLYVRSYFLKKQKSNTGGYEEYPEPENPDAPDWTFIHAYGANIYAGLNIIF